MAKTPKWPKSQKFHSRGPVRNVKKWPKTTTFFFSLILIYFVEQSFLNSLPLTACKNMKRPSNDGQFPNWVKMTKIAQPRTCRKTQNWTKIATFFFLAYSYIFSSAIISEHIAAYRMQKYEKTCKLWPIPKIGSK